MTAAGLLCVAAGGLGALARWFIDAIVTAALDPRSFPYAVTAVNLSGSFAMGLLAAVDGPESSVIAVVATGFLGAFTTFSTVMVTVIRQVLARRVREAAVFLTTVFAGSALCAALGLTCGSAL